MSKGLKATAFAILAAALYAINVPLSKLLMQHAEPTMMAAFLYLGAGIGLFIFGKVQKAAGRGGKAEPLSKADLPYTVGMVVLDIIAPILLMLGIARTSSANVSLLNNFEIVATSLIALLVFKEAISKRTWLAIVLVAAASVILSFEGEGSFDFNVGSLLVLGAATCWGFENNCTKNLSNKNTYHIVFLKGIFSGIGSLIVAICLRERFATFGYFALALLLGFVAYGLSIFFYIKAQRIIGAAKTSACGSTLYRYFFVVRNFQGKADVGVFSWTFYNDYRLGYSGC